MPLSSYMDASISEDPLGFFQAVQFHDQYGFCRVKVVPEAWAAGYEGIPPRAEAAAPTASRRIICVPQLPGTIRVGCLNERENADGVERHCQWIPLCCALAGGNAFTANK